MLTFQTRLTKGGNVSKQRELPLGVGLVAEVSRPPCCGDCRVSPLAGQVKIVSRNSGVKSVLSLSVCLLFQKERRLQILRFCIKKYNLKNPPHDPCPFIFRVCSNVHLFKIVWVSRPPPPHPPTPSPPPKCTQLHFSVTPSRFLVLMGAVRIKVCRCC